MSTTVFLVNPASAGGATGRRWPEFARRAAALGLQGDAHVSEAPGHLVGLAREAAVAGASLVVAVGGDGTVHEVVNGLASAPGPSGCELAIIPRGTGIDFVRTLGIPAGFDAAVRVAAGGAARQIDLGRAAYLATRGGQADAFFANIASVGMSGEVARRTNETTKALGGKVSYLYATLSVFARWRASEVRVSVDGQERRGAMHDVVVANGRYFGGGMMMCPDADPSDGLLDVLTIGDLTKRDLILTLPKTYRGRHLPHPKAELIRGSSVTIEADEALPLELDGEQPGTTPVRLSVVPGALRVRVPAPA
ncbi:MAG: diacylglycerol kinase family lipid kinase [Actinobacteria bacterium]|nr:diacylglycerol kinase family lipid kinase [Actinomycetota bacterium]